MTQTTSSEIRFYDQHPKPANFYEEVLEGLRSQPCAIAPKFFYDETGSKLFDAICRTPEYYPTRTEMAILRDNAREIAGYLGKGCLLIEPGSGNSMKVRLLLDDLQPHAYMPMDISGDYLLASAERIAEDFPGLEVCAACMDFTRPIDLPYQPKGVRRVAFFPGSSIGNFEPARARVFLANLAHMVGEGGGLLIGVDLKKDPGILNAAYNDAQGVTAAFNLNLLTRINRELDGDFDLDTFRHHAFYNPIPGRVEMHLISACDQDVTVDGHRFHFGVGEGIHTECSYKYSLDEFRVLAQAAGFRPVTAWCDPAGLFSVHYLQAAPPSAA